MPYGRKRLSRRKAPIRSVRSGTKRRYVRKARRYTRNTKIVQSTLRGPRSWPLVVPDQQCVKLCYETRYAIIKSASNTDDIIFRGNSLYDPEYAVGGGQPLGYDQWAAIYNYYSVIGSKIEVRLMPAGDNAAGQDGLWFVLLPSNSSTSLAPVDANVQPYAKSRLCQSGTNGAGEPKYMSHYMKCSKMLGCRDIMARSKTAVNADPSTVFYWHLSSGNLKLTTTTWCAYAIIKITYYARFFNRKNTPDV